MKGVDSQLCWTCNYVTDTHTHTHTHTQVTQHRDIVQTEHSRVTQAKVKLENLCRELQKHCKAVAVSAVCCPVYSC